MEHLNSLTRAADLIEMARQQNECRQYFQYTPATGSIVRIDDNVRPPLITVSGGEEELGALLKSFELWEGAIKIGVLDDQIPLDFWLY
jgi:hypothetical protein